MLPALIPIFKIVAGMIAQKAISGAMQPKQGEAPQEPTGPVTPSVQTGVEGFMPIARQMGLKQGLGLF